MLGGRGFRVTRGVTQVLLVLAKYAFTTVDLTSGHLAGSTSRAPLHM